MNVINLAAVVILAASLWYVSPVAAQKDTIPAHANCSYDRENVAEYVPEYEIDHLEIEPSAIYAAEFESTEFETDIYVYWAQYPYQAGVTEEDSHAGDHEPVYVLVDESTGAIERIQFSAYHYLKGTSTAPPTNASGHPELFVNRPYHHYTSQTIEDGETPQLRDFCGTYESWYANGWEASREAVLNPWSMRTRDHWWSEGRFGFSFRAIRWQIQRQLVDFNPIGRVAV